MRKIPGFQIEFDGLAQPGTRRFHVFSPKVMPNSRHRATNQWPSLAMTAAKRYFITQFCSKAIARTAFRWASLLLTRTHFKTLRNVIMKQAI